MDELQDLTHPGERYANLAVLIGTVAGPSVSWSRGGKPLLEFRVRANDQEPGALAIPVVAYKGDRPWGVPGYAEGDRVVVIGRIERSFEKKGPESIARTHVRALRIIVQDEEKDPRDDRFVDGVVLDSVASELVRTHGRKDLKV